MRWLVNITMKMQVSHFVGKVGTRPAEINLLLRLGGRLLRLMALLAIGIVNSLLVHHTLIYNVPPSIFLVLIFFHSKSYFSFQNISTALTETLLGYCSVLTKRERFIKMRAAFLALSSLHNLREDGGKKGSSHFDENLSF